MIEVNEIKEKYLPIGSIVSINGYNRKIMITGFFKKNSNNVFCDYSGCNYPEGKIDGIEEILFNHDQITALFYSGMVNDEEIAYKTRLKSFVSNVQQVSPSQASVSSVESSNVSSTSQENVNNSGITELDINSIDLTQPQPKPSLESTTESNPGETQNTEEVQKEPKYIFDSEGTLIAIE